ncbi:MAG TPA: hypothetical protein VLH08_21880, partial [Acidobacteriota bacterium]|nr:hypothetical protein [Acidobacteriota bacterium]
MKNHLLSFILLCFVFFWVAEAFAAKSEIVPFDPQKADAAGKIDDPAAATKAYLDSVPAERRQKTKAYARGNYALDIVDF